MSTPFRSGISAEQLASLPDIVAGKLLEEERVASAAAQHQAARVEAGEESSRNRVLFEHDSHLIERCPRCGKTRYLATIIRRGLPLTESATPVKHCACEKDGVVELIGAWVLLFGRSPNTHRAEIKLSDPKGRSDVLHPVCMDGAPAAPFEWGEDSPGARELAIAILALVAGTERAVKLAETFVRKELAPLPKTARGVKLSLYQVRLWIDEQEAASGAAA